ncbi:MAG: hypothetical protein DRQ56_05815 [Gammaproteobacteria bacterium]|nr:MAG: hypothetical protein DRQ56_05815 [Gammaproteobacteria bacterium]
MSSYFWNVLIWIDQGVNTWFAPLLNFVLDSKKFGDPDETLSSVFGKEVRSGNCKTCYYICRMLHWIDPGHCKKSIEDDEG